MKLTQREMKMIGMVLIMAMLGGGYYTLLEPQMKQYRDLKSKQSQLEVKCEAIKSAVASNSAICNDLTVMDNKTKNLTALFFPELRQEKFIQLLVGHLKNANVDPSTIQFGKVETVTFDAFKSERPEKTEEIGLVDELVKQYRGETLEKPVDPAVAEKEKEEIEKILKSVKKQIINLTFTGSYADLINLLQQVESYPRRITIEEVTSAISNRQLVSTVRLGYYALPKIHKEQDADFYGWTPSSPSGKKDPMAALDMPQVEAVLAPTAPPQVANDFFLMLNPIISDLTTVVVSKMSDRSRESYVYADNPGVEPVTLELIQKDNRYYYHYKTSSEQYPENYLEPAEFTPSGNMIRMQVVSSKRSGPTDKSGIDLTVLNKTDLKLLIEVENDDKVSRINWHKKVGDISVK